MDICFIGFSISFILLQAEKGKQQGISRASSRQSERLNNTQVNECFCCCNVAMKFELQF
jgi:hypothetical protein